MRRAGVALLVVAALTAGCGDGEDPQTIETSVDAIVDVTPRFIRQPVRIHGTAVPVNDEWFVLRGKEDAILVAPEAGTVEDDLQRGEEVTVSGVVQTFNRLQVAELDRLAASSRHPVLRNVATGRDGAFISADHVVR